MNARNLLDDLRTHGFVFDAQGLSLVVDAPKDDMTAEVREALAANKREILRLLHQERRRFEEADRRGLIIKRSREPGWISLHDPTTGEWHEIKESENPPWIVQAAKSQKVFGGKR